MLCTTFCNALFRAWPAGNACTHSSAPFESVFAHDDAMFWSRLFFSWPDGRPFT